MNVSKMIITSFLLMVAYVTSFSVNGQPATSSSSKPSTVKRNIAIIGGTHGNEYTGVWMIKVLQQEQKRLQLQQKYPNLNISTVLGNPDAHYANQRFIDTDLNREFSADKLCNLDNSDGSISEATTVEAKRANEINEMLGSKCSNHHEDEKTSAFDVAIDLHTTTSNMGTTLIVNEGDVVMAQGAAFITQQCRSTASTTKSNNGVHCLMHAIPDKGKRPNLSSTTKHGFTIEVGPVPQGLLRHDAVLKTECALYALLDYLQLYYSTVDSDNVEASRSATNLPFTELLHEAFPTGKVPAYRTVPAQRLGEMSGKIVWPSDDENPNFPKWMIHEHIQDHDYDIVRVGDPLFVTLDGSTITYDGSYGNEIYLLFINEGGYYYSSSGTGISVAMKTQFDLTTAILDPIEPTSVTGTTINGDTMKQEL